MQGWRDDGVVGWARARDLLGPAKVLHENGVNGKDLLNADEAVMVKELRFTCFAATKLLRARQKRACQTRVRPPQLVALDGPQSLASGGVSEEAPVQEGGPAQARIYLEYAYLFSFLFFMCDAYRSYPAYSVL